MADQANGIKGNRILAQLPGKILGLRGVEEVTLRRGDVLVESGPEYGHVYFPHEGLVSLVIVMSDGTAVDAAVVGREGVIGHPYLADFDAAPARAIVQIDGRATKVSGKALQMAFIASQEARDVLGNFARAFLAQTLQTVACNAVHGTEERLAKWLLQCTDRTRGAVPLTQEILAEMLAVSRPTLTLTAKTMQTAGLIRYSRGRIDIVDRQGIEKVACPCYRAIRRAYETLLPLTYA